MSEFYHEILWIGIAMTSLVIFLQSFDDDNDRSENNSEND